MEQGTVKFFNGEKGYGFIARDSGERDMFVHISSVADGVTLRENDRVRFSVGENRGKPAAQNVTVL